MSSLFYSPAQFSILFLCIEHQMLRAALLRVGLEGLFLSNRPLTFAAPWRRFGVCPFFFFFPALKRPPARCCHDANFMSRHQTACWSKVSTALCRCLISKFLFHLRLSAAVRAEEPLMKSRGEESGTESQSWLEIRNWRWEAGEEDEEEEEEDKERPRRSQLEG